MSREVVENVRSKNVPDTWEDNFLFSDIKEKLSIFFFLPQSTDQECLGKIYTVRSNSKEFQALF